MKIIKNLKADEIRKSILQLAIQGNLVKQDPNDEPASELVKRIYAEKQKLIKEGKIKKDKNESYIFKGEDNCYYEKIGNNTPVKLEDLPFDIPDNWTWIRLKSISVLNGGYAFKSEKFSNEGIRVIRISDFDENGIKNKDIKRYPYSSDLDSYRILPKDILLCMTGGTVGKSAYIKVLEEDCYINQRVALIRIQNVNTDYFYSVLCSSYISNVINTSKTSTNDNISMKLIEDFLIPIPPMNEQIRIIVKLNSCEPLINQYCVAEERLSKLEDEFPEKLKKSILQYAIEGKLVKQDPNDEPASVLLERIKAEKEKLIKEGKIKRDKNESYIYQGDDKNYYEKNSISNQNLDVPFDIPDKWKWVQIKDLFIHSAGKALNSSDTEGKKYPYITTSNVYWNSFVLENIKTMYYKDNEIEKCSATKGDLLVLEGGDIGRAAIWNFDYDIRIQNHIHRLRPLNSVNVSFYYFIFFLYKNSNSIEGRGIGLQGLSSNRLKSLIVPLPPYKEQGRIVDAINRIFDLI